ncbi:hypothetical protein [Shewanella sp. NKUCC06_TVS]|uniref:hypothetical protein n=1 Tax=Shewanella sp. NKUCC06_TVS TaxID=2842128 RepID=UPI001C5B0A31|nr:hypothetical protein [Shewanella sp. NKUCC06_TVS]MBW3533441.1 hypothetical protein [Shewanella sp. NKUCC06_TVS]
MSNSLFSGDRDWKANACLNWSHDSMGLYIEGYREAADKLVHDVVQSGTNQDILVFPISFLYRQYIELQLKHIIRESRIYLEEEASFPESHKIGDLWNTVNSLMVRIIKDHDKSIKNYITREDVQTIKMIITEFVKVDPESFAFRYPKDKNGNKNLDGIQHINLRKLHDQMDILKEKLDKYCLCVSLLRGHQDEMRAEYGS